MSKLPVYGFYRSKYERTLPRINQLEGCLSSPRTVGSHQGGLGHGLWQIPRILEFQ